MRHEVCAGQNGDSGGALGGIRTPNLLIRSQMLYPLSYERWASPSLTCPGGRVKSTGSVVEQAGDQQPEQPGEVVAVPARRADMVLEEL
jgi:hypothetical protein